MQTLRPSTGSKTEDKRRGKIELGELAIRGGRLDGRHVKNGHETEGVEGQTFYATVRPLEALFLFKIRFISNAKTRPHHWMQSRARARDGPPIRCGRLAGVWLCAVG